MQNISVRVHEENSRQQEEAEGQRILIQGSQVGRLECSCGNLCDACCMIAGCWKVGQGQLCITFTYKRMGCFEHQMGTVSVFNHAALSYPYT